MILTTPCCRHRESSGQSAVSSAPVALIILLLCSLACPAFSQTYNYNCTPNVGIPTTGNFESNFLNTDYEVVINQRMQGTAVDLNSAYSELFYSLNNLNNQWIANGNCPIELVFVGKFPDARYFSISTNDMHYVIGQHLADYAMDPADQNHFNPFLPGTTYQPGQEYLVPVSLGYVPQLSPTYGGPPGGTASKYCAITTLEEDNILDGTQRHLSMDWNTQVQGTIGVSIPNNAHVVDSPSHQSYTSVEGAKQIASGPNTAGIVAVRSYLAPPYVCPNGAISCQQAPCLPGNKCPSNSPYPDRYFIVRDAYTGCAYTANQVKSNLNLYTNATINCSVGSPPGCNAILSTQDPSGTSAANLAVNWLSQPQKSQHTTSANVTPENCYANGDPGQPNPPMFANKIAWTRSSEFRGTPGPDDSYIGGAVSTIDLASMAPGGSTACPNGCVMRFRFKLPGTPAIPCTTGTCGISGTEALRYMSITFWYQPSLCPAAPSQEDNNTTDSNAVPPPRACNPISILSLADTAFAKNSLAVDGSGYVTLLVNVNPQTTLPSWWSQTNSLPEIVTPRIQGVVPVNTPNLYTLWSVNNCGNNGTCDTYTLLDLTQLPAFSPFLNQNPAVPLLMTIRNTMPAATFPCSGAAVPYATAEFTNIDGKGGGLMGPYAPLVDYPNFQQLSPAPPPLTAANLPAENTCGLLNNPVTGAPGIPSLNSPGIGTTGTGPLNWPVQYWPTSGVANTGNTYLLQCTGGTLAFQPQIDLVATQFPVPVNDPAAYPAGPQGCNAPPYNCSQIVAQAQQENWAMTSGYLWQPPLPLTIVGSGFGYLPGGVPAALATSPYLEIKDDGAGSVPSAAWDTNANSPCQMFIANWTDSAISLVAGVPGTPANPTSNLTGTPLPLNDDQTPLTFFQTLPLGTSYCAVNVGDNMTFTVTNPQSYANPSTPGGLSTTSSPVRVVPMPTAGAPLN